jgi:uncharacterized RDD family membrane protein YckC
MQQPQLYYAGFWKRFGAYLIDGIIISVVIGIVFLVFGGLFGLGMVSSEMDFSNDSMQMQDAEAMMVGAMMGTFMFLWLVSIVAQWLYFALMEASSNQGTLGKMALGIKVTDTFGHPITFGRATGRFFGKILSGAIFMIGYIMAAFTERKQALHDMMAGTLVLEK